MRSSRFESQIACLLKRKVYARVWLRVVKGVDVSPKEFLNGLIRLRGSKDVEERQKYLRFALENTINRRAR